MGKAILLNKYGSIHLEILLLTVERKKAKRLSLNRYNDSHWKKKG